MSYTKSMKDKGENRSRFIYLKSIGLAMLFTAIIFLIVAILITYTSISESILPIVTSTIMVMSIAFSGILSAVAKEQNGLIHGLITGLIYIALIIFIGWVVVDDFSFNKYLMIKSIIGILTGGIGGMIGVNLK